MFEAFYDQTVTTQRLGAGTGNTKEYSNNLVDLACAIQQIDSEVSSDFQMSYGKNWMLFCPIVDIIEGDFVIWDSKTYRVMAVDRLDFLNEDHMEVSIRIFES